MVFFRLFIPSKLFLCTPRRQKWFILNQFIPPNKAVSERCLTCFFDDNGHWLCRWLTTLGGLSYILTFWLQFSVGVTVSLLKSTLLALNQSKHELRAWRRMLILCETTKISTIHCLHWSTVTRALNETPHLNDWYEMSLISLSWHSLQLFPCSTQICQLYKFCNINSN